MTPAAALATAHLCYSHTVTLPPLVRTQRSHGSCPPAHVLLPGKTLHLCHRGSWVKVGGAAHRTLLLSPGCGSLCDLGRVTAPRPTPVELLWDKVDEAWARQGLLMNESCSLVLRQPSQFRLNTCERQIKEWLLSMNVSQIHHSSLPAIQI